MKYTPSNQVYSFEPITTPNKNIQSFFMKSEQSFLIPESEKFYNLPDIEQPITFLFTNRLFVIEGCHIEQDIILDDRFNIEKYGTIQKCVDAIYSLLITNLNGRLIKDARTNNSKEGENIKENEAETQENEPNSYLQYFSKNNPVQIVFGDFMCRSDVICLIDLVLNHLGFRAVMILPVSLCLSFYQKLPFAAYIYSNGFSFVEDYCLADSYDFLQRDEKYSKIRLDDEDFAEEFSRLSLLSDNLLYSCLECGFKEDSEDKIKIHIAKEHQNAALYKFERYNDLLSTFKSRTRYLFKNDSYDRISSKIFTIGFEESGYEKIDNFEEKAIGGAILFAGLDLAKEVWMTDFEWRTARLRILKEKLLFYF